MNNQELLKKKSYKGLQKLGLSEKEEYKGRLRHELEVIKELDFATYFLVMEDIVAFCQRENILSGTGRGSSVGSLLCYCLGITQVDPIKYGLYFERFMDSSRVSPPDIDFDTAGRERIISYLEERYGKDRVARVGSINFLRSRSAVKDIGRVLKKDYKFTEELANLVPPPVAGLWDSFERECEVQPKLLDPKYEDIIQQVKKLWGITRSYGTHAGGVAIAPGPINQFIPLYKDKDGNPISQFDWRDLEDAGLLKFDILGLKTLEIIQLALEYIRVKGTSINLRTLEDRDEKAYQLLQKGDLDGIFQLGGGEKIRQVTVEISPNSIEDLSLINALCRPGPLSSGLVDDAVAIRNGKKKATYIHESLRPILEETYSICIYQETVMRICTEVCGYSLAESYRVMKYLGKKLKEKLKAERPKFIAGAAQNGIPVQKGEELFNQLEDYGQYLFNKSHSLAYSVTTYWTAYLKAHFPVEFYASLLAYEHDPDKVILYSSSAREHGIDILPPDVNKSGISHQPEGNAIRFGLSHIKGMPKAIAEEIIRVRDSSI